MCTAADFQHIDVESEDWKDPDDGVVKNVSLREFFDDDYHLRAVCVLLGAPSTNKTQVAEAMASEMARRYAETEEPYYIKVGSVAALKPVKDYLRSGVPVMFEEFGAADSQQQRSVFSVNFLKQLADVEGGGTCRAIGNDIAFAPHQPRFICYNGTVDEFMPMLGQTTEMHKEAIKKRCICFNIRERMIKEELVQDHKAQRRAMIEAGKKRAAELDAERSKRARND